MFLNAITSNDPQFKTLEFRSGLNILVADRTDASKQGDSRNSIGKTSFVKILRYLLGGDLPKEFKAPELRGHEFRAQFTMPSTVSDSSEEISVTRPVSPTTRLRILGWSATQGRSNMHVEEWRALVAAYVFHIPSEATRPTPGQLWGQFIRTYFGNPIKGHASETDWESGVKTGFLLGLAPSVLGGAGELDRLTKQGKAIRKAVKEGALAHLSLDESALRTQLVAARRQRDRIEGDLKVFRVDEQYAEHQASADAMTADIQYLSDEALALTRRRRELEAALRDESGNPDKKTQTTQLLRLYEEVGLILPEAVHRRFEEVESFHASVIRNRQLFLEQEQVSVNSRLESIEQQRSKLDERRARLLTLLEESVALSTFLSAQRDLAERDSEVSDLERRLEAAASVASLNDTIKVQSSELAASVRIEVKENESKLDQAIALFGELGAEIYADRDASLYISTTSRGTLKVLPQISGDASVGVRSVETFILDMVCMVSAIQSRRSPNILVHDSHLFDAIDGRQVAACLNIGARLAEQYGFQYIVTLNSDFLESVESESEGAFDGSDYVLSTRLTDENDEGGLLGFRFG